MLGTILPKKTKKKNNNALKTIMTHLYIETELQNWNDISLLDQKLQKLLLFRGQSNKEWEISSSIERLVERFHPDYTENTLPLTQEKKMIEEFQWKYPLFNSNKIEEDNYVEWLSIMQHYGAVTRLVDFTDSFFVAAHMAIYESNTDASVWAVNSHVLNQFVFDICKYELKTNSVSHNLLNLKSIELANEKIENSFNQDENNLLIIRPKNINERLYRQQGLFVMPTNLKVSFKENLNSILENIEPIFWNFDELIKSSKSCKQDQFALIKINIPKQIHSKILRSLREMNVNSEILFPGIEGLAKSLNYSTFNSF